MRCLHCCSVEDGEQAEAAAELDPKLAREAAKLAVRCAVCEEPAKSSWLECPSCTARAHLTCLASHFIQVQHPCCAEYSSMTGLCRAKAFIAVPLAAGCQQHMDVQPLQHALQSKL